MTKLNEIVERAAHEFLLSRKQLGVAVREAVRTAVEAAIEEAARIACAYAHRGHGDHRIADAAHAIEKDIRALLDEPASERNG